MNAVAGSEIRMPSGIDGVTAEWLTAALRVTGDIGADVSVATAEHKRFAEGVGLLSELHRTTISYDGAAGDAPTSVITKFAISDPAQRGLAEALGFYTKELHFYTHLAADMPIRVPRAFAAIQDPETSDFVLVMEDLSNLRTSDQQIGVPWEDALRTARNLAKLHGAFHEHERLPELAEVYTPIENPVYLAALPGVFAAGWENAQKFGAEHITPEIKTFGDRYGELVPFLLSSFMQPATILHGDWRADNLFYLSDSPTDENQDMAVVDFQITGQGSGAYDLGYFAGQSIAPEVRSGRDAELIDAYLEALKDAGVDRDREEFEHQYRLSLAHCMIYAVASFQSYELLPENSQKLMTNMLGRSVQAITDNDSLSLLPD